MTDVTNENAKGLALLREPFPANQISYLPKGGAKLAYVGHAALTDRLLDADPAWTWEPLAMSDNGLPVMDELGGMWIKLTVCGITRLGYGHAGSKTGGDAIKEVIGDALRNAAMRFGAALDLWHKGDLHAHEAEETQAPEPKPPPVPAAVVADWCSAIEAASDEELNDVMKGAYACAEKQRDRDAYVAFRTAKNKRKVAA
jgi:hypothetical protein